MFEVAAAGCACEETVLEVFHSIIALLFLFFQSRKSRDRKSQAYHSFSSSTRFDFSEHKSGIKALKSTSIQNIQASSMLRLS
jgi:hypothetical protein